jgi:hypothetical protein
MRCFALNERGRISPSRHSRLLLDLTRGLKAIASDEKADRLFSVGDLVDRGPESLHALGWLLPVVSRDLREPRLHDLAVGARHPYLEADHLMLGGVGWRRSSALSEANWDGSCAPSPWRSRSKPRLAWSAWCIWHLSL